MIGANTSRFLEASRIRQVTKGCDGADTRRRHETLDLDAAARQTQHFAIKVGNLLDDRLASFEERLHRCCKRWVAVDWFFGTPREKGSLLAANRQAKVFEQTTDLVLDRESGKFL